MYVSSSSLPHLFPPEAYFSPSWWKREQILLSSSWHFVGVASELSNHGNFMTRRLLGKEIMLRNFEGELVALSNVCAHRHCLIRSEASGQSASMSCQYHGWEYGPDGKTRRIPGAKDFAPIDKDSLCIPRFHLEKAGQLLFVKLSDGGPSLAEWLGSMGPILESRFGDPYRSFLRIELDFDANWKVAIENSLEAYHVEAVHPKTFRRDPGEARSEHQLGSDYTAFYTDLPFATYSRLDLLFLWLQKWVLSRLGGASTRRYSQHHLFPTLLCSFTDAISLVHGVQPLGPNQARSLIYQFGYCPKEANLIAKALGSLWGRVEGAATRRILQEDFAMYSVIQRGIEASSQRGALSRKEERIHRFQEYWMEALKQLPSNTDRSQGAGKENDE